MNTVSPDRELSLYQIIILCGTRETKHQKVIAKATGTKETFVSTWATRGIPHTHWLTISKLAGVTLDQLCHAQSYVKGVEYRKELSAYYESVGFTSPKSVDTTNA